MIFQFRRRHLLYGLGRPVCAAALLGLAVGAFAQATPSGIWATAGSAEADIAWNTVPGATYDIYRGTSPGAESATPLATVSNPTYADKSVTAGTTYYYKVTAVYGSHQSGRTAEVSCTPGSKLAGAPLVAAFAGNNSVTVKYSAVPLAAFYRIFKQAPFLGWQLIGTAKGLSFTDSNAPNGQTATYQVQAGNSNTDGAGSNSVTAVAGDSPLGTPPINMALPGNKTAFVQWSPISGATGYVVYRSTTAGGEGTQPFALTQTSSLQNSSLTNGTTYYYKVAAFDASGTGVMSPEASATAGAKQLQGGPTGATSNATSVTLNWEPVSGAASYYLVRGDYPNGGNGTFVAKVGPTTTSYTDKTVVVHASYRYLVYPADLDGAGVTGPDATVTVGDNGLAAPTGVYTESYGGQVGLFWNPVAGANGYLIYRSSNGGSPVLYADVETVGTNPPYQYNDKGVSASTVFTYWVAAYDSGTESKLSSPVTGQPDQTQLPGPVASATASGQNVTLYWSIVPGAQSYLVARTVGGVPGLIVATGIKPGSTATMGTFTDTNAPQGVECMYEIAAVNASGTGAPSNPIDISPGSPTPATPTGTFAVGATSNGNDVIDVSVNPVPGVSFYNVYRSTKSGGEGHIPYAIYCNSSFVDMAITPGVTYYYQYTSTNENGESSRSPECSVTWGATPLPAAALTATATSTQVNLDWSAVPGATSYDVFRASAGGGYILYQQNVKATTLTDTDVTSSSQMSYQVYALNAQGPGNRSNTVTALAGSATPAPTTGIYAMSTSSGATIAWNYVPGTNVSYNLYRSTTAGGEGLVPLAVGVGTGGGILSYNDSTAAAGKVYYYTVTAVTPDNQGAMSAEVSVKSQSAELVAPSLQLISSPGKVALTWSSVAGAASYNLFRLDPIAGFLLYKPNLTGTSFTDTSVISGVEYLYYVAAVSPNGQGASSQVLTGKP